MKKLYTITLLFFTYLLSAQTASVIYLYNLVDATTPSVDIEVINKGTSTQVTKINNVTFTSATAKLTVPSSTLLRINFFKAGTSTVLFTSDNVVYDDNSFQVAHLFGTAMSKQFSTATAFTSAASGKVGYSFIHSSNTFSQIDFTISSPFTLLADNFVKGGKTGFTTAFDAANISLGITPFDNNASYLYLYQFNGASYSGSYIYFFTSENDLFMLEMNGTVTKLSVVTSLLARQNENSSISVYPNPASDKLTVGAEIAGNYEVEIYNSQGARVFASQYASGANTISLSELNLTNGFYQLKLSSEGRISTAAFIKQ